MKTPEKYLEKTQSAVIKLIDGIDSYMQIIKESPKPIFRGRGKLSEYDREKIEQDFNIWREKHKEVIEIANSRIKEFSAESFALGTLCGSLLQISAMGIQMFSDNDGIPEDMDKTLVSLLEKYRKSRKFCIGRRVHDLPIGLIIYAGRNQYNHMADEKLHRLNQTIFELLARNYEGAKENSPKHPSFDLENDLLFNYSTNITALLGWRDYDSYYSDMESLIIMQ